MALIAVDVAYVEAVGSQPEKHFHFDFFENMGAARRRVLVSNSSGPSFSSAPFFSSPSGVFSSSFLPSPSGALFSSFSSSSSSSKTLELHLLSLLVDLLMPVHRHLLWHRSLGLQLQARGLHLLSASRG